MVPDPSEVSPHEQRDQRLTDALSNITAALGSFPAVVGSVLIIVAWALAGPVFHFSDTWQLVINTGTTIITFNMVFIIQNTQNRDGKAMQVKLDAILHHLHGVDDRLMGLELMPENAIDETQRRLHAQAQPGPATGPTPVMERN